VTFVFSITQPDNLHMFLVRKIIQVSRSQFPFQRPIKIKSTRIKALLSIAEKDAKPISNSVSNSNRIKIKSTRIKGLLSIVEKDAKPFSNSVSDDECQKHNKSKYSKGKEPSRMNAFQTCSPKVILV